ncbi:hypothetical protein Ancab_004480 [Ancistrocladus abbreviatus]
MPSSSENTHGQLRKGDESVLEESVPTKANGSSNPNFKKKGHCGMQLLELGVELSNSLKASRRHSWVEKVVEKEMGGVCGKDLENYVEQKKVEVIQDAYTGAQEESECQKPVIRQVKEQGKDNGQGMEGSSMDNQKVSSKKVNFFAFNFGAMAKGWYNGRVVRREDGCR